MADAKSKMSKVQGGITLGKRKFWSLSYADDVVLLATNAVSLKQMMKRFIKLIRKRGVKLNTKKSKIIMFINRGRRINTDRFTWEDKEIEKKRDK